MLEEELDHVNNRKHLIKMLNTLQKPARELLYFRYGFVTGCAESIPTTAKHLGITPRTVRKREKDAIEELRASYNPDPQKVHECRLNFIRTLFKNIKDDV